MNMDAVVRKQFVKKWTRKLNFLSHVSCLYIYISSRVYENQHDEICSHLSDKASKGKFLKPEKLQNHSNEGKGKGKKKERGEEKKAMVALLVLIIATLDIAFDRKKMFDAKGPCGDNFIKNPARYIVHAIFTKSALALGRAS